MKRVREGVDMEFSRRRSYLSVSSRSGLLDYIGFLAVPRVRS